jgi:hypothetical protein
VDFSFERSVGISISLYRQVAVFYFKRDTFLVFLPSLSIFGPKCHSRLSLPFQNPKSLDFQGPPHQTALVMDFPPSKSIRPAPYKQQVY